MRDVGCFLGHQESGGGVDEDDIAGGAFEFIFQDAICDGSVVVEGAAFEVVWFGWWDAKLGEVEGFGGDLAVLEVSDLGGS